MTKFKKYDVAELLGFTPIARVQDSEIWSTMLTPNVRSFLGDIKSVSGPHLMETRKGLFPGDEVSNLNNHRLSGENDLVRFPYLTTIIRTKNGALVIKRDAVKIKALAYIGDIDRGRGKLIFKGALRDRRFDGTRRANDTALLDFPFDDSVNKPLPLGRSVELSIYGYLPGSSITDIFPEEVEYENFVANPFTFLDRPQDFLRHFKRAWNGTRSPGQIAAPIPDVSQLIGETFAKIARKAGYDFIENASSHYHVAMWAQAIGYKFTYQNDADNIAALTAGIKRLKDGGMKLSRMQESWLCVLQSLPKELIPEGMYLGGPTWPQNNIDQNNLWMHKPLTDKVVV